MTNQSKLVEDWNTNNEIGTTVTRYMFVSPLRNPMTTKTRSEAWLMGGHTAMILVEGVAGGVMLESVVKSQVG